MTQSMRAVRAALLAGCQATFASSVDSTGSPVYVCLGQPGNYQPDYIVAVGMDTRQSVTRATMGLAERVGEVDVTFSCFVSGDSNETSVSLDACEDLTDAFEAWLRVKANLTLGGACTDSWVSNINGPRPEVSVHPESGSVTGRVAESIVTVSARLFY